MHTMNTRFWHKTEYDRSLGLFKIENFEIWAQGVKFKKWILIQGDFKIENKNFETPF
jgi:hypothetical protein